MRRNHSRIRSKIALMLAFILLSTFTGCTPKSFRHKSTELTPTVTDTPMPSPENEPTLTSAMTEGVKVTPTPTQKPTPTPTPTPALEFSISVEPAVSYMPPEIPDMPSPIVTQTPTPMSTPTPAPTATPTVKPTAVPTEALQGGTKMYCVKDLAVQDLPWSDYSHEIHCLASLNLGDPITVFGLVGSCHYEVVTESGVHGYVYGFNSAELFSETKPSVIPPLPSREAPVTYWANSMTVSVFDPVTFAEIGTLEKGTTVQVIEKDYFKNGYLGDYLDLILWNDQTAIVWKSSLSDSYVEPRWDSPRERKDLDEILMNLVSDFRESEGYGRWGNPYDYTVDQVYTRGGVEDAPAGTNLGEYLAAKGLRVAIKDCLTQDAAHEGFQIGCGMYGSAIWDRQDGLTNEELCKELFQLWYTSTKGHKENMKWHRVVIEIGLDGQEVRRYDADLDYVAVMTVVEYYTGTDWAYCAIMSFAEIER